MVIVLTKAKMFAAIPVSFGMLLTIPDLDPDPWMEFKVRFAEFLAAHMDEESLQALLDSKFFKMLSCNEMKPSLPGHIQSSARAWFRLDGSTSQPEVFYDSNVELEHIEEGTSSQQEICYDSIVEPEYRIGLGSITTSVRQDQIHVGVHTPSSGVKNRSIKNTLPGQDTTSTSRLGFGGRTQRWASGTRRNFWLWTLLQCISTVSALMTGSSFVVLTIIFLRSWTGTCLGSNIVR